MPPISSFPLRFRPCKFVRLPNSTGISPLNWLPLRFRPCKFVRLPNSTGISPLNWLTLRPRPCKFVRLPNSTGISPLNWLTPRTRVLRAERLPNSGEMTPIKFRRERSIPRIPLASIGPIRSHSEMRMSVLQFRGGLAATESRIRRSVSQSPTSMGFSSGFGTTTPLEHCSMSNGAGGGPTPSK